MAKHLTLSDVPVGQLRPNEWNTNIVSPENEERIKNSIERFGFFRPVIVRQVESVTGYEILGGQHRWQVAVKLGFETVPIVNLGYIDDKKAKEISLVDNGRYGEDDTLALAELLKELGDVDEIMTFMPYSADELDGIFTSTSIALDELDLPDDDDRLPELPTTAAQTHQIMRFKIPIEDADFVTRLVDNTMASQGYTDDDSMSNAGNALVHLLRLLK